MRKIFKTKEDIKEIIEEIIYSNETFYSLEEFLNFALEEIEDTLTYLKNPEKEKEYEYVASLIEEATAEKLKEILTQYLEENQLEEITITIEKIGEEKLITKDTKNKNTYTTSLNKNINIKDKEKIEDTLIFLSQNSIVI
jgi:hypothetical protein